MNGNEVFTAEDAGNFQASKDEGGGKKDGFFLRLSSIFVAFVKRLKSRLCERSEAISQFVVDWKDEIAASPGSCPGLKALLAMTAPGAFYETIIFDFLEALW